MQFVNYLTQASLIQSLWVLISFFIRIQTGVWTAFFCNKKKQHIFNVIAQVPNLKGLEAALECGAKEVSD